MEDFLNQLADHFRTTLGIQDVHIETRTIMPRRRNPDALYTYTSFGYPLYGYDPTLDLAYLMVWDTLWAEHQLQMRNIYYGDYGAPYIFIDDGGWGYDDAYQYDATHPAPLPMDGGDWNGGSAPASGYPGGGDGSTTPATLPPTAAAGVTSRALWKATRGAGAG